MYHYDWTHNPYLKRRNEKHEGILDLSAYDENNQPPSKQESSFHGDYVIDEDGDKILLNGQANLIDDNDNNDIWFIASITCSRQSFSSILSMQFFPVKGFFTFNAACNVSKYLSKLIMRLTVRPKNIWLSMKNLVTS